MSNLGVNRFLPGNTILPCNWEVSEFIDHKHILTCNLKIIQDNNFKKLFTKGPKHRENKTMPFEKAKLETTSGLIEFIETWCSKHDHDKNLFNGNQIQFKN